MERPLHAFKQSQYKFLLNPTLAVVFYGLLCGGSGKITFCPELVRIMLET